MSLFPPTLIVRHRKENLKKCSLRGLESRKDLNFFTYPVDSIPSISNAILLSMDGELLSSQDGDRSLVILDGTWRYAARMERTIDSVRALPRRKLPTHYRTAYPRCQGDCVDATRGLASVEALFIAYHLMGRPLDGILNTYYWKDAFLIKNKLDEFRKCGI